ncbi:hypothetical protein [Nocardia callitridis]|uniref:Luciferase-like domain-containing protein n=1 Tax=Nocardia callitridis TaxID=648753 RepID=A0ABP9L0G5_9NOCA
MTLSSFGKFGVFRSGHDEFGAAQARELEQLGFGAFWLGGSAPSDLLWVQPLLEATERVVVGGRAVIDRHDECSGDGHGGDDRPKGMLGSAAGGSVRL